MLNSTVGTTISDSASFLRVGGNSAGSELSDIKIQNLQIFNKILNQAEVDYLYNTPSSPAIVRRINTGGTAITATDGEINWQANSVPGATSGTDYTMNTSNVFNGTAVTWTRHASIPASIPDNDFQALFDSERWDAVQVPEMLLTMTNFTAGNYTVRLYIGEASSPPRSIGFRNYDVKINGVQVATDLDAVEEFGAANVAGMVQFDDITVTDTITIEWIHSIENPQINGIEIIKTP